MTTKTVSDYLAALRWDGVERIHRWLVDYAGAEDSPYVRQVSRAVLIAAVRRARHPGCQLDEMLILEGPQGCGKTRALRILGVDEDWFLDSAPIGATPREIIEATSGKWIVEAAELRCMSGLDIGPLKAFLSIREDVARTYPDAVSHVPRQFVVVGTTSQGEYLKDATGNRRFWTVCVQRFDLERLRADRDQLWAEAAEAESESLGESIRLDPRLYEASEVEQEMREAYVVIGSQFGVEFSSESLDAACTYVDGRLREQVVNTTLANPSSYRIQRVKAG
jgi:predicted P-loop ATPase